MVQSLGAGVGNVPFALTLVHLGVSDILPGLATGRSKALGPDAKTGVEPTKDISTLVRAQMLWL